MYFPLKIKYKDTITLSEKTKKDDNSQFNQAIDRFITAICGFRALRDLVEVHDLRELTEQLGSYSNPPTLDDLLCCFTVDYREVCKIVGCDPEEYKKLYNKYRKEYNNSKYLYGETIMD